MKTDQNRVHTAYVPQTGLPLLGGTWNGKTLLLALLDYEGLCMVTDVMKVKHSCAVFHILNLEIAS